MKLLGYIILIIFLSIGSLIPQYTEIHCKHFFYGYPKGTPSTNDLIIRDIYALSSNDSTKFADWVAYRLDSATISGPSQKERKWEADPWLEEKETLEPDDYKDAPKALNIDRGHQAPLANFKGTDFAFETNYLSNITPQKSILNQGIWKDLEDKEREFTLKYGLIFVYTGPLFEKTMASMPKADEKHSVPSGYWKIIIIPNKSNTKKLNDLQIFAFIFGQDTPKKVELENFLVSLDEIEKRSKLDFLNELDLKSQDLFEKSKNSKFKDYFSK